ncbi:MAG TPA: hypothetical protein VM925_25560 [Labilithrix sp.]|nr:hypothetical protein [Labilithrix sp.]
MWSGYVANYQFASGSDRITVTFTSPSSGTVVFGATPATPPPVDFNVPYPPGCGADIESPGLSAVRCAEQIAFTMVDAKQEPDRVRFAVDVNELWTEWCNAQTLITALRWVIRDGVGVPDVFSCAGVAPGKGGACQAVIALPEGGPYMDVPQDGGMPTPPTANTPVDCDLERTCALRCTCSPSGCKRSAPAPITFDLHVSGNEASGRSSIGDIYLKAQ